MPELQCDLNEHFDKQVRVVLENAGHIDPEKIDDYIVARRLQGADDGADWK